MWSYEKRLQYPVKIKKTCPKTAQLIISQYGGPDGESAAAMRYLSQRYAMPYEKGKAIMTDIGSEASEMFSFIIPPKVILLQLLGQGKWSRYITIHRIIFLSGYARQELTACLSILDMV